jgi:hypothetical protein
MRGTTALTTVLVLATASASRAAEPPGSGHVGNVGIDFVAAPAIGVAVPFRLSDHLTFRATLGAGSTQSNTGAWTAGGDLRYTLSPFSRTSVFLAVQAGYAYASSGTTYAGSAATSQPGATPVAQAYGGSGGLFGGGVGVRYNVSRGTAAYGEVRYDRATSSSVYDSWGSFRATDNDRVSFGLGVTFGLK